MDKETQALWKLAESSLNSEKLFIVDISYSKGRNPKLTVLVDGDEGVNIDDCSRISRELGERIEEDNVIDSSYTLDVGSPGLDTPLKFARQYAKNHGRKLKVKLAEGETVKGVLESSDDKGIVLKSGKKGKEEIMEYQYKEIEWAKVQVSF